MRLYLIALSADFDQAKVAEFFDSRKEFGNWFYSMPGSVFVYSSIGADSIKQLIKEAFPGERRLFVAEVAQDNFSGYIPKDQCAIIARKGAYVRYDLDFSGYYLQAKDMPPGSGIYCVYRCVISNDKKRVTLLELLYVGASTDMHTVTLDQEYVEGWNRVRKEGEELCYSASLFPRNELAACAGALVYLAKPLLNNDAAKSRYAFKDAYVNVKGDAKFLPSNVVAYEGSVVVGGESK